MNLEYNKFHVWDYLVRIRRNFILRHLLDQQKVLKRNFLYDFIQFLCVNLPLIAIIVRENVL